MNNLPALLIPSTLSNTIVLRSNAPALLPWQSIANSPDTCKPSHSHCCDKSFLYLPDKWLMDSQDTKVNNIDEIMYTHQCIDCLTLFFTSRTISKYGIPGFTINMSAPSATSRSYQEVITLINRHTVLVADIHKGLVTYHGSHCQPS